MGGKGPPPIPTNVLKARGSPRWKRGRANEPIPAPGLPTKPKWMVGPSRRAWVELIEQLNAMDLACKADAIALARYCVYWEEWQACVKVLRKQGALLPVVGKDGNVTYIDRPEVARHLKIGEQMLKLEREFGLTPSARAALAGRIKGKEKDKPKSEAATYLGKKA